MKAILLFSIASLNGCMGTRMLDDTKFVNTHISSQSPVSACIKFDTVRMDLWGKALQYGGRFKASFNWKDSSYLISSSCNDSTMKVLNFNDPHSIKSIPLPPGMSCYDCAGACFISSSRFFFLTKKGVIMMYADHKWVSIFNVNNLIKHFGLYTYESLEPYEFYARTDTFFIRMENHPAIRGKYSKKKFNYPITARLQKEGEGVNFIGAMYPQEIGVNYYALLKDIYQHFHNDKIFYTFDTFPDIWEYSIEGSQHVRHVVRSKYQASDIKPLGWKYMFDKDMVIKHKYRSGNYEGSLIYDPYRNCYYRFFNLPLPERNEEGYYNTHWNIRVSVMALDMNFDIIDEQLLPPECNFVFYTAVAKEGLYINYGPVINPGKNGVKFLKVIFAEK